MKLDTYILSRKKSLELENISSESPRGGGFAQLIPFPQATNPFALTNMVSCSDHDKLFDTLYYTVHCTPYGDGEVRDQIVECLRAYSTVYSQQQTYFEWRLCMCSVPRLVEVTWESRHRDRSGMSDNIFLLSISSPDAILLVLIQVKRHPYHRLFLEHLCCSSDGLSRN